MIGGVVLSVTSASIEMVVEILVHAVIECFTADVVLLTLSVVSLPAIFVM